MYNFKNKIQELRKKMLISIFDCVIVTFIFVMYSTFFWMIYSFAKFGYLGIFLDIILIVVNILLLSGFKFIKEEYTMANSKFGATLYWVLFSGTICTFVSFFIYEIIEFFTLV